MTTLGNRGALSALGQRGDRGNRSASFLRVVEVDRLVQLIEEVRGRIPRVARILRVALAQQLLSESGCAAIRAPRASPEGAPQPQGSDGGRRSSGHAPAAAGRARAGKPTRVVSPGRAGLPLGRTTPVSRPCRTQPARFDQAGCRQNTMPSAAPRSLVVVDAAGSAPQNHDATPPMHRENQAHDLAPTSAMVCYANMRPRVPPGSRYPRR